MYKDTEGEKYLPSNTNRFRTLICLVEDRKTGNAGVDITKYR